MKISSRAGTDIGTVTRKKSFQRGMLSESATASNSLSSFFSAPDAVMYGTAKKLSTFATTRIATVPWMTPSGLPGSLKKKMKARPMTMPGSATGMEASSLAKRTSGPAPSVFSVA